MLKAVVFDLDNTLVNFWEFKQESAKAAAGAMVGAGLGMEEEAARNLIFKIYEQYGVEYQLVFTDLLKPFKFEKMEFERVRNAAITSYLRVKDEMLSPYDGVEGMLESLREEYKLAILTDATREQAHKRIEFCGLKDYFNAVGTFHDTNVYKPGVEPFEKILGKLEVGASEAVMVGDNPSRDIRGAKRLGMKTIFAKWGHMYGNDGTSADFEAAKPEDILEIVKRI
ncbi:MAG: HAD family hydrolase [Candidatus Micrarchaeota archaeon]